MIFYTLVISLYLYNMFNALYYIYFNISICIVFYQYTYIIINNIIQVLNVIHTITRYESICTLTVLLQCSGTAPSDQRSGLQVIKCIFIQQIELLQTIYIVQQTNDIVFVVFRKQFLRTSTFDVPGIVFIVIPCTILFRLVGTQIRTECEKSYTIRVFLSITTPTYEIAEIVL